MKIIIHKEDVFKQSQKNVVIGLAMGKKCKNKKSIVCRFLLTKGEQQVRPYTQFDILIGSFLRLRIIKRILTNRSLKKLKP
jgi:hypothetical protein